MKIYLVTVNLINMGGAGRAIIDSGTEMNFCPSFPALLQKSAVILVEE